MDNDSSPLATLTPFPPLPETQALSCSSFSKPPLDGSLTIPDIYDWHYHHTPNHPIFVYPDAQNSTRTIPWLEAVRAVHLTAQLVTSSLSKAGVEASSRPIVAIFAACDTISYFTLIMGIARANCIPFLISTRNSPIALAHLLQATDVKYLFVGQEKALHESFSTALEILKTRYPHYHPPETTRTPLFEDMYRSRNERFELLPTIRADMESTAFILHSSGSSAFPKPIQVSHSNWLCTAFCIYFGERDLTGKRLSSHAMPMFHGMGVMQTGWAATCGVVITAAKPQSPAVLPSSDSVYHVALETKSDLVLCVPSFLESWSADFERFMALKNIDGIIYGGGPLNTRAGNTLIREGVSLFNLYGCSELGAMSQMVTLEPTFDAEYFKITTQMNTHLVPKGSGQFELVVTSGQFHAPRVFNGKLNGQDAYYTNDLLSPHPSRTGYWRIYGRNDDQITHSTGEKTNPVPLEGIINEDLRVKASVMFGHGRFNVGILIDPAPGFELDPTDNLQLSNFRNQIWPSVQRMNKYGPKHSRLFKEMIIVASPYKPFEYTAKNNIRRKAVLSAYKEEIENLYKAVEETTQGDADSDIIVPADWSFPSTILYVRALVQKIMQNSSLADDADVFQAGCDSLQATWIRNTIIRALKDRKQLKVDGLPPDVVFEHPSIASLAHFISDIASRPYIQKSATTDLERVEAMQAVVERHSQGVVRNPSGPTVQRPHKNIVLVTGTTGSLGTQLLVNLAGASNVERIYAVNRRHRDGLSIKDRQLKMLEAQEVSSAVLQSEKVVFVDADFDSKGLGLDVGLLEEIRTSVTHIIHNAWRVDFNLALISFEDNIRGVRELINVSLSSRLAEPPAFMFISSIAVTRGADGGAAVFERAVPPEAALGNGYGQSKWVSETILRKAAEASSLRPTIIRLGQICGSTRVKYWNTSDWFPAMVKSSIALGCFPSGGKDVSWIPIDSAAQFIVDALDVDAPFLHLVHPRPTRWDVISRAISSSLKIPLSSYSSWLNQLETMAERNEQSASDIPALKLLAFFRRASGSKGAEAMGLPQLDTTMAQAFSTVLDTVRLPQITHQDVQAWLDGWTTLRFLQVES